ncbi:glutamine-tRNA ligase [Multifurca ochricompacta]|uniref:glutamine--tRNA ligase n=1 Tax=Multifurca ochricompacta TaxID=376703 RepID=A0AAD4QS54_9AGAM|nr:glutamine-tRNA ligase [Multifurca ochricompacta]
MAPPKGAPVASPETETYIDLFKSIGLTHAKAAEAAKSAKSAAVLQGLIERHALTGGRIDEKQAGLVAALAVQGVRIGEDERGYVVNAIVDRRLKSTDQVNAAVKYLEANPLPVDDAQLDRECGVGFSITPEALANAVSEYVTSFAVTGWANMGAVITALKSTPELRWVNPLELKNAVESALTDRFGAKEAAKPKGKEPKESKTKVVKAAEGGASSASTSTAPKPATHAALRDAHLKTTGGLVYTRFPPEPNGFLHIGHSKAIFINFGYAAHHGGKCFLRYDDTNPEAEEAVYFESILEIVRWLGYEPWKITYSSDYFNELYDLAVELTRRDKAYVCHCTGEEIHTHRGGDDGGVRTGCVHRTRPVEESLREFENMKLGKYKPGEAILRMKQDLDDPNPQMWDLIAYRVLLAPHHRTGDKWKIYPTYDFTHCLVDSFENISHSLCTVEFIASRQSYEWLCDAVDVYKPRQSEYGRLALQGTITSKRKLRSLVEEGYVLGWDDPRLYTLIALRRRGVPAGAIISFVGGLGVSTAGSNIQLARFDQAVRSYLENSVPRLLMVLRPLKVTLENVSEDYIIFVEKALHPKVPALGMARLPFTRTVYIDKDDFRLEDSPDYFRLAPGKTVGLFQAPYPITCTSYKTDLTTGEVTELICRLENGADGSASKKPKAFIQWVAEHAGSGSPVRVDETRIFHRLFKSDNPLTVVPDYKADIDPDSLETVKGALVEVGFWALAKRAYVDAVRESKKRTERALAENATEARPADPGTPAVTSAQLVGKECVRFQGLRVAYFALDNKAARVACLDEAGDVPAGRRQGDYLVLNRIVSLKEDSGKAV